MKTVIWGNADPPPQPAGQGGDAPSMGPLIFAAWPCFWQHRGGSRKLFSEPHSPLTPIIMVMADPRAHSLWPCHPLAPRVLQRPTSAHRFHPMKEKVNVGRPHHLYYNTQLYWNFPGRAEILMFNLLELMGHRIPILMNLWMDRETSKALIPFIAVF